MLVTTFLFDWSKAGNTDDIQHISALFIFLFPALKSSFVEEPLDSWVVRGEEVRLPCRPPQGHPPPSLEWRKNGELISEDER